MPAFPARPRRLILRSAVLMLALLAALSCGGANAQSRGGGDGFGADDPGRGGLRQDDAARVPRSTRVEYVAVTPPGQANAAANALTAAGAVILRRRNFGALNRALLVLDLRGVSLTQARQAVGQAAPGARLDAQHFYRYAQGQPRLYAAALTGDAPGKCRLNGARIGMIDGPVQPGHPALAATALKQTSALLPQDRPTAADHGTAIAALLAGQDKTGALTGFAAGARVYAVAAFAQEPRGPAADVERIGAALDWLTGQGVRLVNMSFAGPVNSALNDLLDATAARGTVMFAAAGNDASSAAAYPAAARAVIAVTAVDAAGRRYRAANTGAHIAFAAPGVDLYVATRQGGAYASGTSYAAPIVTAFAARLQARGVGSAQAIQTQLRRRSRDLGTAGRDPHYGWGLVQAPGC